MNTLLLGTDNKDLARASDILRSGGLVAIPTETVYGLGANAFDKDACLKIFAAKGRPADNPLIVHIAHESQLADIVAEVNDNAKKLIDTFWPGPLTIVMKKSKSIPYEVSAGLDTVAVRMPSHKVAYALLDMCGLPIAAPSANTSGKPSPTSANHVFDDMNGKIEAIVDGGSCTVGLESTVIDVTDDVPRLLRPGGVTYEQLCDVLGTVIKNYEFKDGETPRSPGVKYKHYAPKADVYVVRNNIQEYVVKESVKYAKVGVLCHSKIDLPENCIIKHMGDNPDEFANTLFANLRDFDDEGVDVIFAEDIDDKGINLAVSNRLYKAAGYKFI
ncbi:MAG: L-threonylcarbamoyladenylate synthase [Clostridia bacterium]|nr:L-threonylcarbamoyladenylate synthase [Clostridia bacterium]